jgi:AcrR family transcriptional regulator
MVTGTRERLLDAAERLVAQHGLAGATQRRIAEAAGQANNSAVGYHIGDRGDVVRAVLARHFEPMDRRCREMRERAGADDLRHHVECLVRPLTEHLDEIGVPSWYARFAAHVIADPTLREHLLWQAGSSEVMRDVLAAVAAASPAGVSASAMAIRGEMALYAIVHTCAERERALAVGCSPHPPSWAAVGDALVDATTGMLLAPGGA